MIFQNSTDWQEVPPLWDAVRCKVDYDGCKQVIHHFFELWTLQIAAKMSLILIATQRVPDVVGDGHVHILAGLMSAVSVMGAKMSGTQQKADQTWDWLKRVWLAWVIINGIGAFVAYIRPLFNGLATLE